jgi:exonuclease VII large subunit
MEVFNSPELAACCLDLEPLFVTAIGHKEDVSLVQKVADKAFITPTALGQYLHRLYNDTVAELQHSKARLVEAITVQLDAQYNKQVQGLEGKVRQLEELNGQRVGLQQRELELMQGQLLTAREQVVAAREQAEALHAARDRAEALRAAGRKREVVYWVTLAVVAIAAWIFFIWRR